MDHAPAHTPSAVKLPLKVSQGQGVEPGKNVSDQIAENVQALNDLRATAEAEMDRHQRLVEKIALFVSRPHFVYFILVFVGLWIASNWVLKIIGLTSFDPPPFFWLQGLSTLSALVLMVV